MWQPIETAPKDGTWIVLARESRNPLHTIPYIEACRWYDPTNSQWDKTGWVNTMAENFFDPTHWAKLP